MQNAHHCCLLPFNWTSSKPAMGNRWWYDRARCGEDINVTPQTWQLQGMEGFLAAHWGQVYAPLATSQVSPTNAKLLSVSASLLGNAILTRLGSSSEAGRGGGEQACIRSSLKWSCDIATSYVPPVSEAIFWLTYISAERPMMQTRNLASFAALMESAMEAGSQVVKDDRSTRTSLLPKGGIPFEACITHLPTSYLSRAPSYSNDAMQIVLSE
jgi:hypothetical protein